MTVELHETALFTIAGVEYAFGLEWITASRSVSAVGQIKTQAARVRASHLVWRSAMHQVGLARISMRRRHSAWKRWRAAAAAFADLPQQPAEPHTMIGAFSFMSGEVWVVAASQGRLFADGDRFFTDKEAAKEHFRHLYDRVPRWGAVYAPAEWSLPRANGEGPLFFLAPDSGLGADLGVTRQTLRKLGLAKQPGTALRRLRSGFSPPLMIGACLIATALAGLTASHLTNHWRPPPAPPPQRVLEPWYPTIEQAGGRLEICVDSILRAVDRLAVPGWEMVELTCSNESLTVAIAARRFTPLSTLAEFQPDATLQSATRTASLSQPLSRKGERVQVLPPLRTAEAMLAEFGRLDERVHGVNLFSPPSAPTESAPLELGVPRPRPYRVMGWTLQTEAPPLNWRADLSALANVEVAGVSLKRGDSDLTWTIRGTVYVAP